MQPDRPRRIAVVIPAFNEAQLIAKTLAGIPSFVDLVIVVDDASTDGTLDILRSLSIPRLELVLKESNEGVGQAILDGYRRGLELGADVLAVMAGDNQMDPADLPAVLAPVLEKRAAYVKGNRFLHPDRGHMPWARRIAGRMLALVTSLCAGRRIHDSQCGYTAIDRTSALVLLGGSVWPRFGYPNDVLVLLAQSGRPIQEVCVRPIYGAEKSGVRFWHALVILFILGRRLWLQVRNAATHRSRQELTGPVSHLRRSEQPTEDPV